MKKRIVTLGLYLICIVILILMFFNPTRRKRLLESSFKFGIAEIYKHTGSLKNGTHWHYKFTYKGKLVDTYNPINKHYSVKIGERYIVKFYTEDPTITEIYYNLQVNNRDQVSPDSGWTLVPDGIVSFRRPEPAD